MMKISDDELLAAIWNRQIRQLSTNVIAQYVGGGIGVCKHDDFWFDSCSYQSQTSRHLITSNLGKQQLLKRIRTLGDQEKIKITRHGGFYIDNDQAREAFRYARQWWLNKGVPTGYSKYTMESGKESARANTVQMDDWKSKAKMLEAELMDKYEKAA